MGILDFLFPKYCVGCRKLGSYLCSNCFSYLSFEAEGLCAVCNRPSINELTHPACQGKYTIDGIFSGIAYNRTAKKLIYNFKYKPYVAALKNLLVEFLYEGIIQKEEFNKVLRDNQNYQKILAPIPLYHLKQKSRGYNQSALLALGLSEKLNMTMRDLLLRTKNTPSQAGLKQQERRENINRAFVLKKGAKDLLKNSLVFLVDDILTSGATLLEAARILKRAGAKRVWGLTLARD